MTCSTRAVVTMPGIIQYGQAESDDLSQDLSATIESEESDKESDSKMNECEASESSPNAAAEKRPKRKNVGKQTKKEGKEGWHKTASAMICLTEKLVDIQNAQFKMLETAQKRTEDLLVQLEADQQKLDKELH